MKKLYEVEVELALYVMAENEDMAVQVAQDNAAEEADMLSVFNFTAIRPKYCLANWENGYPYGSDTNETVGEVMAAEKEAEKKQAEREEWDKKQLKIFAE